MNLKGYTPPFKSVAIANGDGEPLTVKCYGLGLDNVMYLAQDYAAQLVPLYDKAKDGKLDESSALELIVRLAEEVPTLVNLVVYMGLQCGDDEEMMETITSLPVGVKVELIDAIISMTLHSESGQGKVMEIVSRAIRMAWADHTSRAA